MLDMLEDWSQWQEEILYGEFVGGQDVGGDGTSMDEPLRLEPR